MLSGYVAELLLYLVGTAIVGLIGAVWKLYHDLNTLRLHVAEAYVSNRAMDEVKDEVRLIRDVVYRIALKMDVPVFSEPYRG